MTSDCSCVMSLAAFVLGLRGRAFVPDLRHRAFVRDQVGGALSSAAVPSVCLGQTAPPLCRCAKCTTDLILRVWWAFYRCTGLTLAVLWAFHRWCRYCLFCIAGIASAQTRTAGCPCAWLGRRSGIKEEPSALGRHGGQPRSRPSQAHGRTNHSSPLPKRLGVQTTSGGGMSFTLPQTS
jgi:hypothetical protein